MQARSLPVSPTGSQATSWAFPRGRSALALILLSLMLPAPARAQSNVPAAPGTPAMSRTELIEKVLPAVVNVSTVLLSPVPKTRSAQDVGSGAPGAFRTAHGFGSGFVIDGSGLIVTNRHVVENAVRIGITFQDQTVLPARVVGRFATADVALLEVTPPKPLPAVGWGDSDKLKLGEDVIAIGNPLGLGGSVSGGIVSGLNRDIRTTPFDDFIQTDAAINHGNSGGPLFNMQGLVVGINTAIFSPTDTSGSIGISFALPSQVAAFIIDQTKKYGRVRAGSLDVRAQTVTPDIAAAVGLPEARGAIVLGFDPGSTAAAAGLHRGDVITEVGDDKPPDSRAIVREVALAPLDQPIPVKVWRQGQQLTLNPVVRPYKEPSNPNRPEVEAAREAALTTPPDEGLRLSEINKELRARFKLAGDIHGVLVTGVLAYSPADARGFAAGDVIVEADQKRVTTPAEVTERIAAARRENKDYTLFLLAGPGGDRFVTLPMHLHFEAANAPSRKLESQRQQ